MNAALKERPILFQGEMVRALLAGRKTQTRRAIKPQVLSGQHQIPDVIATPASLAAFIRHRCPYGVPGDRLWVRERGWIARSGTAFVPYASNEECTRPTSPDGTPYKPCPSIHMPRWASRITLEVTGVRVERLQSITEADALAEGVWTGTSDALEAGRRGVQLNHVGAYSNLWESINGPGTWGANPWVWVVEFRRTTS